MDDDLPALAAIARTAARASRDLLRARFGAATVASEHGRDIKLDEDLASQALIVAALQARSDLPILTEESGWIGAPATRDAPYWIVDPIDGSYNYRQGVPLCAVAVALCRGRRAVIGCIDDFVRDESFCGGAGLGLFVNDRAHLNAPFVRGALATGFPVGGDFSDAGIAAVAREFTAWKKVRMIGTAALALAWTSVGRFDGYIERGTRWWDVAAGVALIEGGGGHVRVIGSDLLGVMDVFAERGGGQEPPTGTAA